MEAAGPHPGAAIPPCIHGIPSTYLRRVEHDLPRTSSLLCLLFAAGLTSGQEGISDAGPFCENSGLQQLVAQPSGGVWGGPVDTAGVFDPSVGSAGSPYTVTYAWNDTLGNPLVDSVQIVVLAAPIVQIDSAGPLCESVGAQQLSASPTGGIWDGDLGAVDPSGLFNPIFGPQFSPYAVWYSITDTNGCSASDTLLIEVLTSPLPDVIEPLVLCPYDSIVQVMATPPGGSWSGDVDGQGNFDPSMGSGSYWGLYTVTDTNGCSGSSPATITVLDAIQAQLSPAGPFCADAADAFLWATPFFGTYGGAADSLGYFSPQSAGPGQHLVTYTYTCPGCCPTTDSLLLTVNPLPELQLIDSVLCADLDTAYLSATPAGGSWGGSAQSGGLVLPTQLGPGLHPVSYSYTDSSGCANVLLDSIAVRPRPSIGFTSGVPFCAFGPADTLIATPAGGIWSGGVTPEGVLTPGADTTLIITYTYGDSISCTASRDTVVQVHPLPAPLLVPAGPFCSSDTLVQLVAVPSGGTWIGAIGPGGIFDPMNAAVGGNTVAYSLTDTLGCTGVDSILVVVVDATPVVFGMNGPYCANDGQVVLTAFPPGGVWGGAAGPDGGFDTDVTPGEILVTYFYSNGVCASEATDTITVDDCTFIRERVTEELLAFPLPADQLLTVTLREAAPISLLTWTAASGRSLEIPFVQQQDRLQLDVSGIPSGTYWVLVEQAGRRYRARVLVAH